MTSQMTSKSPHEKIKLLEKLLAEEIEKVAELIKENKRLERKLEEIKMQRDCWQRLYRKIRPNKKVTCDREKAMVEYGEVDMSEVLGSK